MKLHSLTTLKYDDKYVK